MSNTWLIGLKALITALLWTAYLVVSKEGMLSTVLLVLAVLSALELIVYISLRIAKANN